MRRSLIAHAVLATLGGEMRTPWVQPMVSVWRGASIGKSEMLGLQPMPPEVAQRAQKLQWQQSKKRGK